MLIPIKQMILEGQNYENILENITNDTASYIKGAADRDIKMIKGLGKAAYTIGAKIPYYTGKGILKATPNGVGSMLRLGLLGAGVYKGGQYVADKLSPEPEETFLDKINPF